MYLDTRLRLVQSQFDQVWHVGHKACNLEPMELVTVRHAKYHCEVGCVIGGGGDVVHKDGDSGVSWHKVSE